MPTLHTVRFFNVFVVLIRQNEAIEEEMLYKFNSLLEAPQLSIFFGLIQSSVTSYLPIYCEVLLTKFANLRRGGCSDACKDDQNKCNNKTNDGLGIKIRR